MITKAQRPAAGFLFLCAASAAVFLDVRIQVVRFTVLDHAYRPDPVVLLPAVAALFFAAALLFFRPAVPASLQSLGYWPLFLLALAPVLTGRYFTRGDLIRRLDILLLIVGAALAYLALTRERPAGETGRPILRRVLARFETLSRRKKTALLFAVSFLVYSLAGGVLVGQGVTFSGDEPNYLLSAHSLLHDRDINLRNQFDDRDYFHFYSRKDNPHLRLGIYGRFGKKGHDYIYPINLPGISVLMLPHYAVSHFLEGTARTFILKSSLSLWAALLGIQVYLLAATRWKREDTALTLWAVYGFTVPVIFYSIHLYPEIPIAFFSLLVYRKVTSPERLSTGALLGMGFLLSLFPWFGLKFNIILWPLILVCLFHLRRDHGLKGGLVAFLAFPAISAGLFAAFTWRLYGSVNPFSIYDGVMTAEQTTSVLESFFSLPLYYRVDSFFNYFLDQRDGLLLYAPVFVFAFAGFVEIWRRARREFFALGITAMPFILNYAFFTHRQGYAPPGRVLAPLSWIAAIGIGYFLVYNRKPFFTRAFGLLAGVSFVLAVLLLFHPSFLYQPTTHEFTERPGDLFVFLSNMRFFLPSILPSFIKVNNLGYWPNYVWILAVAAFIAAYGARNVWPGVRPRPALRHLTVFGLCAAAVFLWVLHPRDALYPVRTFEPASGRPLGLYPFSLGRGVVIKPDGALYLHEEKSYRILFGSKRRIERLKIFYGSEEGNFRAAVKVFDLPLFAPDTQRTIGEFEFDIPVHTVARHLYLYEVTVDLEHLSDENLKVHPYLIHLIPSR
ncbi:MAG: hypothetical protein SCM96_06055 [Acidobacteriota bacterium]|nr:hypothetical protein [Acidobacteriota bacterium]